MIGSEKEGEEKGDDVGQPTALPAIPPAIAFRTIYSAECLSYFIFFFPCPSIVTGSRTVLATAWFLAA